MADQTIDCVDCNSPFQFTEAEQKFYQEKELSAPKRCQSCRTKRRRERQGESTGEKQYHETVCSECSSTCTVPFVPREGKPVFCRDCFKKKQTA